MKPPTLYPVPLEPLINLLGITRSQFAQQFHVSGRYAYATKISIQVADRLAIQAGYHPAEIWPQWYDLPQTP